MITSTQRHRIRPSVKLYLNKKSSMDTPLMVMAIFCLSMNWPDSQGQNISDACYGTRLRQTTNVLECNEPLFICISEVRVYQWHKADGCPHAISSPVASHCCAHNITRCYKSMKEDSILKLQKECDNNTVNNKCELYAGTKREVNPPCSENIGEISPEGSVRSIIYTCQQGACRSTSTMSLTRTPDGSPNQDRSETTSKPSMPTPTSKASTLVTAALPITSAERPETTLNPSIATSISTAATSVSTALPITGADTGAVVGGVIGGLVVIGIIVTIVIIYRRRVTTKTKNSIVRVPDVVEVSMSQQERSKHSGYVNVGFNESTAQTEVNFYSDQSPTQNEDNISVLYTKVNKNGKPLKITERQNLPDEYDHVQGESALFPVIRHGDYDHVAMADGDDDEAVNTLNYADPSSNPNAYDNLHRFPSKPGVVNDETYNRLHHPTVSNPKGSGEPQNTSNYDYASVPAFGGQESSNTAINNSVYDLAKAIPNQSRTSSFS